ncbi:hypothetical protein JXE04_00110 [Patescibacteria group bacterium]|nr:hypothetical protein [Patescibacteria group bacterium]
MAKNLFIGRVADTKNTVFMLLEDSGDGIMRETFNQLVGGDSMKKICRELIRFYKRDSSKANVMERAFTVKNLFSEMIAVNNDSRLTFLKPLTSEDMQLFYNTFFKEGKYV